MKVMTMDDSTPDTSAQHPQQAELHRLVDISHRRLVQNFDDWKAQMHRAIDSGDPHQVLAMLASSQTTLPTALAGVQALPMAEQLTLWMGG